MEEVKTSNREKLTSNMLTKKTLALMNPEEIQNHHTLVNRLDNSNIKADSEFPALPLMLEPTPNSQTKETQWECKTKETRENRWETRRATKDKPNRTPTTPKPSERREWSKEKLQDHQDFRNIKNSSFLIWPMTSTISRIDKEISLHSRNNTDILRTNTKTFKLKNKS